MGIEKKADITLLNYLGKIKEEEERLHCCPNGSPVYYSPLLQTKFHLGIN